MNYRVTPVASSDHFIALFTETIGNLLVVLFDGIICSDAKTDSGSYDSSNDHSFSAASRRRAMQDNDTSTGERADSTFTDSFECGFRYIAAATKV